jgi:hypothetical protein
LASLEGNERTAIGMEGERDIFNATCADILTFKSAITATGSGMEGQSRPAPLATFKSAAQI